MKMSCSVIKTKGQFIVMYAESCTHQYFKNISETPLLITKCFICLFKVFLPHAACWPPELRFLWSDVAFWQTCYAWRWKSSHNIRTDGKNKTYEKITADRRVSHNVNPRVCCSTSVLIYEPKIAAHRPCGSLTVTTTWHHKNTPSKKLDFRKRPAWTVHTLFCVHK